jgi:hypothetical protein
MKRHIIGIIIIMVIFGYSRTPVFAELCPDPDPTGTVTVNPVSSGCTFNAPVDGPQNGNLVIDADKTLTVGAGQTLMWNPGYNIDLSKPGAQIVIMGGATIKQGDICLTDPDADGYPADPTHTAQTVGPCTGEKRPRKVLTNPTLSDCDNNNGSIGNVATCYPDTDGDGVFSPNSVSVCLPSCTGMYRASPGTDCNDGNANVWLSHAACNTDNDKDTYTTGAAANTTCLNNASCDLATFASNAASGSAVTSYESGQLRDSASGSTDLCDIDAGANPGVTAYSSSQNACGNYDWNSSGVEELQYGLGQQSVCYDTGATCAYTTIGSTGYTAGPPACGVSGTYIDTPGTCDGTVYPGCSSPAGYATSSKLMPCR